MDLKSSRLNVIIFGLNRFPRIAVPCFHDFLGQVNIKHLNIIAGFIVPADGCISNKKSGEHDVILEDPLGDFWKSSIQHYVGAYHQDSFCQDSDYYLYESSLRASLARLDIFQDDYKSILNYLGYLYASYRFANDALNYLEDGPTLLLRPDVVYSSAMPLSIPQDLSKMLISLGYDKYGEVNDRFFLSSSQNILSIMRRIVRVSRYLFPPWRYFHSECFARWYLQKYLSVDVQYAPPSLTAKRIRSNGIVEDTDSLHYEGHAARSFMRKNFFRDTSLEQLLISLRLKRALYDSNNILQ